MKNIISAIICLSLAHSAYTVFSLAQDFQQDTPRARALVTFISTLFHPNQYVPSQENTN